MAPTDGNGVYTLPAGYVAETGQTIQASQHNQPLEDIANALTARLPVNGTKAMTGNLPMGANRITGLADAVDDTDAVTKQQLDAATGLDPSTFVTTTGDQNISGVKTFASIPVGPAVDPNADNQFTRKAYVDAQNATKANDSDVVKLTGSQTVAGTKTFTSIPVAPASDPTSDNQLARKAYVDTKAAIPSSSSDFPVGSLLLCRNVNAGNISNGSTANGSNLQVLVVSLDSQTSSPCCDPPTSVSFLSFGNGATLSGTWKNVSGVTLANNTAGYFVRTA